MPGTAAEPGCRAPAEALCGLDDGAVLAGVLPDGPITFQRERAAFRGGRVARAEDGVLLRPTRQPGAGRQLAAGKRTLNVFAYTRRLLGLRRGAAARPRY